MKVNKIFNVIFAIALFAAFVGMVTCLYNAIDLFTYTTFSPSIIDSTGSFEVSEIYCELQKPLAIILLLASIISLVGVVTAGLGLFSQKTRFKKISLIVSGIVVVAFIGFMIGACCVWFSHLKGEEPCYIIANGYYELLSLMPIYIPTRNVTEYTIYSAVMAALLQQLIYFAVIAGITTYHFVRPIIEAKRNKKVQTEVESTETASAEVENTQVENNQNN